MAQEQTVKGPAPGKPGAAAAGAGLLEQILARENLAAAWEAVAANEGMPGVDRVAVGRYARNWEERLTALADAVRGNRYRPSRLRVRFIPKRDGGQRRISIPTVADRVLQRATLQVLLPRLDRKFLSCSYGYRPKRGVAQAVAAVIRYRDRGLRTVLEADIDDCFGSLDHGILMDLLSREVSDWRVLQLMRGWLDAGRPVAGVAAGIALGMPISPLWATCTCTRWTGSSSATAGRWCATRTTSSCRSRRSRPASTPGRWWRRRWQG